MWKVTRKGLLAHKLRLAMTALAVVLGVAFVAGSFVLTDTIERSFGGLFDELAGGIDLQVRPEGVEGDVAAGVSQERTRLDAEVLDRVRAVEGVAVAEGFVMGQAQVIGADGEPVGAPGAPTMAFNAPRDGGFGIEVRDGRLPEVDGEVAIDAFTARTQEFEVGDTIELTAGRAVEEARLVGIVGFGDLDSLLGATVVLFTFDETVERFSPAGEFDQVEAMATEGIDEDALAEQVRDALDDDVEVLTSEELAEESAEALAGVLGVFTTALLAFAGVALFVGIFIIVNTFSITVAQRIREFALLRAVGASRRQVLASVLTEAGILGLLGGVVGVLLGVALAVGLQAMLAAFGMDLPAEGVVLLPRTVVVGVLVGFLVTLASAVAPALKATRVAPVEALQSAAIPPPARRGWLRPLLGAVVAAGGVTLLVAGLFGDVAVALLAPGTVLVFLGIALLSPFLTRPILTVVGAPVSRMRGVPGELARENAMRSPRRTATTASALMIGVGLVGFVTVFGASMSASLSSAIDDVYRMDFDVRSTTFGTISPDIGDDLAQLEEVELALTQRMGQFEHEGSGSFLVGVEIDRITDLYAIEVTEGSLEAVADGGIALAESLSESADVGYGEEIELAFPATGEATLEVVAVFDDASIDVPAMISLDTHREHYVSDEVFAVGVVLEDGVSVEEGQAAVDEVLESYPGVAALDRAGVRENLTGQVDQIVAIVYGLLALAVIIAFVGIVNTLALSVFERVREIGLLRAVGMSRRQVRSMVRWESVLISVLGVGLGLVVGVFFGWLLVESLQDEFPLTFVVPVGQLLVAVVVAVVAGVLAGVLPARRAARVDVLRAITTE
jgi:putative ABC transport system permease protein